MENEYTIIIKSFGPVDIYLVVLLADIGHYVIAECSNLSTAQKIKSALEEFDRSHPAPF
jgi:hypothetical protein